MSARDEIIVRELMIQLDMALTGKARHAAEHTAKGQPFDPLDHRIYYLSDGGYSRVVVDPVSFELFFTSNSLDRVKAAWLQPEAQALIAKITTTFKTTFKEPHDQN